MRRTGMYPQVYVVVCHSIPRMASASPADEEGAVDRFLRQRGHEPIERWERNARKKQCPDCQALHGLSATECDVCGWTPAS